MYRRRENLLECLRLVLGLVLRRVVLSTFRIDDLQKLCVAPVLGSGGLVC